MNSQDKEYLANKYKSKAKEIATDGSKEKDKWLWFILIGCFLFQMLPYCVALNLTNVFAGSDWGVWLRGNASNLGVTFTMGCIGAAFFGPFVAKIFASKISMRFIYSLGVVVAMIGFMGSGLNSVITQASGGILPTEGAVCAILWISNIISQAGVMIFSGLGVNNLISRWWPAEKRGFALGIAFAGGSVGNIWMQQLINVLANKFGNCVSSPNYSWVGNQSYNLQGTQYATYFVMGLIGLVSGILISIFVCRRPLPPVSIDQLTLDPKVQASQAMKNKKLEVSPLATQKYPVYWIFAVGYLVLQMGTIHASMNGLVIGHIISVRENYLEIMATGGTLFGVFCLIGNIGGGIINDKIGPTKSILFAGLLQCLAIFFLMNGGKGVAYIYLYFIIAGLSVYVYTSTPSYTCGRLYGPGQSNNHMAILGIFIAIGFAIVNSITGSLTGNVSDNPNNIYDLLGSQTYGNMKALLIFAIVTMGIGTITVSICSGIISSKGIKGLLEYTPSKYANMMWYKYSFKKFIDVKRIMWTKKDFRNNSKIKEKFARKEENDIYTKSFNDFAQIINENYSNLSSDERIVLSYIFYYKHISLKRFQGIFAPKNPNIDLEATLKSLNDKNIVESYQFKTGSVEYSLTKTEINKLNNLASELFSKYPLIAKENELVDTLISKVDAKNNMKIQKAEAKVQKAQSISINEAKKSKLEKVSARKISMLEKRKAKIEQKLASSSAWNQYKNEYYMLENIENAKAIATKLDTKKQVAIQNANRKIQATYFVGDYNKDQKVWGHDLMMNYLSNRPLHVDDLTTKRINDIYDLKSGTHQNIVDQKQALITRKQKQLQEGRSKHPERIENSINKAKQVIEKQNSKIEKIKTVQNLVDSQMSQIHD